VGRIIRNKHGREWYIQKDLVAYLKARKWLVERMIGNAFKVGIPDLYAHHPKWGARWIDCKVKGKYSFTQAQKLKWPVWEKFGIGIWILTAADEEEYGLLFKPPNWRDYWKPQWNETPDIDKMLDDVRLDD